MSKYTEQAEKFLKDHGLTFTAQLIGSDCPKFCEDAAKMREMDNHEFLSEVNEAGESFAESAQEMLDALRAAQESEDNEAEDEARRTIDAHPLSVQVRGGWHTPGCGGRVAEEFEILLGTGGPASRIIGELNEYAEPDSARFEYQDWFKPWTPALNLSEDQNEAILEFARQFYYGE